MTNATSTYPLPVDDEYDLLDAVLLVVVLCLLPAATTTYPSKFQLLVQY